MANIRENKKNGKIISYRFTACLERDAQGTQVRKLPQLAIHNQCPIEQKNSIALVSVKAGFLDLHGSPGFFRTAFPKILIILPVVKVHLFMDCLKTLKDIYNKKTNHIDKT